MVKVKVGVIDGNWSRSGRARSLSLRVGGGKSVAESAAVEVWRCWRRVGLSMAAMQSATMRRDVRMAAW